MKRRWSTLGKGTGFGVLVKEAQRYVPGWLPPSRDAPSVVGAWVRPSLTPSVERRRLRILRRCSWYGWGIVGRKGARCPTTPVVCPELVCRINDVGAYEVTKFCYVPITITVWEDVVVTNDAGVQDSERTVSDF